MIEITERQGKELTAKGYIMITDRYGNNHVLIEGIDLIINPDYTDVINKNG